MNVNVINVDNDKKIIVIQNNYLSTSTYLPYIKMPHVCAFVCVLLNESTIKIRMIDRVKEKNNCLYIFLLLPFLFIRNYLLFTTYDYLSQRKWCIG